MEDLKQKKLARTNFKSWNEALASGDEGKVAALYVKSPSFLPTLSGKFCLDAESTKKYFKHFLEKRPIGEIIEESVHRLGDDAYVHSGHYNFEVGPMNNRKTVAARFTFVWVKKNGEWKILHHHSSVKPE